MVIDKQKAALSSVFAAIFLTSMKIVVGIFTGSLGILSEALHSALDLCAAVITFFAVRFSDIPADAKHHYGHGKIESFSALIETVLLFMTCGWIIYETVEKLFFGKGVELVGIQWGVLTMSISIIVDASRVKVLKQAAKEHGSQALEADALHFSSDVWSSSVVIGGLVFVWIGDYFNIPVLKYADSIAALGVALLVIKVSIKLGKETIDDLLDTAPNGMKEMIEKEISKISGVLQINEIRIRPSGAVRYININVGIDPNQSQRTVHTMVHEIRETISVKIPRCDIVVSTFPVDALGSDDSSRVKGIMTKNAKTLNND
ncbi:cation diffusion facilitator family transporter [Desulfosporosinus sp. BG]|uniref:cation diffusion facilitator family transporter n=1 Tax=Desulfosporosinus sp. BG TaxID=1633135 RepID=UPI00083BA470|nr:cation diffusion facilitator family transporter [Desulfosporosinus sp. BG]ODA43107.1 Cobalt-zinc-cadmium resistance protein [Desulfosporosinus sp. BG]